MPAKKELIDFLEKGGLEHQRTLKFCRSLIFRIEREAVEDSINNPDGFEKYLIKVLDKIEKGLVFNLPTKSVRAILRIYHEERAEEEPEALNWINYLGKLVTDPEGDEGVLMGYHYDGYVNLCINNLWWGEKSSECKPVVSNDPDQLKFDV